MELSWACNVANATDEQLGEIRYMKEHCCFESETCTQVCDPANGCNIFETSEEVICAGACVTKLEAIEVDGTEPYYSVSTGCISNGAEKEPHAEVTPIAELCPEGLTAVRWKDEASGLMRATATLCCLGNDCVARHGALQGLDLFPNCESPAARACVAPAMDAFKCSIGTPGAVERSILQFPMLFQHADGWIRLGTGWCLDDTKQDIERHLPALSKTGATETELKILCDKYPTCVAIDLGNKENGYLRFSSKVALDAISEPGWEKWSGGCQDDCVPRIAGDAGPGACHVKGTAAVSPEMTSYRLLNSLVSDVALDDPCLSFLLSSTRPIGCLAQMCAECKEKEGKLCSIPGPVTAPGCHEHMLGDGVCHGVCMTEDSGMDHGDCHVLIKGMFNLAGSKEYTKDITKILPASRMFHLFLLALTEGAGRDKSYAAEKQFVPEGYGRLLDAVRFLFHEHMTSTNYTTNYPSWNLAVFMVVSADEDNNGVLSKEEALTFFPALTPGSYETISSVDKVAGISVADVAQTLTAVHAMVGFEHSSFPNQLLPQDVTKTLFQLLDRNDDSQLSPIELRALGFGSDLIRVLIDKAFKMSPMGLGLESLKAMSEKENPYSWFDASLGLDSPTVTTMSKQQWADFIKDSITDCSKIVYVDGSGDVNINALWLPNVRHTYHVCQATHTHTNTNTHTHTHTLMYVFVLARLALSLTRAVM